MNIFHVIRHASKFAQNFYCAVIYSGVDLQSFSVVYLKIPKENFLKKESFEDGQFFRRSGLHFSGSLCFGTVLHLSSAAIQRIATDPTAAFVTLGSVSSIDFRWSNLKIQILHLDCDRWSASNLQIDTSSTSAHRQRIDCFRFGRALRQTTISFEFHNTTSSSNQFHPASSSNPAVHRLGLQVWAYRISESESKRERSLRKSSLSANETLK